MPALDSRKQQPQKSIETPEDGRREIHDGGKVAMKGHGIVDNNRGLTLAAQEELQRLSLLKGDKDGKFGGLVRDSVLHFQEAHNKSKNLSEGDADYLKPDGKVGSRTLKAMEATQSFSDDVLKTTAPASPRNRKKPQHEVPPVERKTHVSDNNAPDIHSPAKDKEKSAAPTATPQTTATRKAATARDSSQQYSTIEARATELSDGIEKQIKGAQAAVKTSEQLVADSNQNREQRSTADKVFGFLHNDAKEHNLRNEGYQAQAKAYQEKADSLEAAHKKLEEQLAEARKLAKGGKPREAQALLQSAEEEAHKQSKVQADLGTSKEKFGQASAAEEDTATWANRGLQFLQGTQMTADLNNDAMATMVGLKAAKMAVSGAKALRAGRLAQSGESTAAQSSRLLAGSSDVSVGGGYIQDGPHQMLITEHRLADGSISRTAVVNSKEGLAYLKQKWGATIGELSEVKIGEIPPVGK